MNKIDSQKNIITTNSKKDRSQWNVATDGSITFGERTHQLIHFDFLVNGSFTHIYIKDRTSKPTTTHDFPIFPDTLDTMLLYIEAALGDKGALGKINIQDILYEKIKSLHPQELWILNELLLSEYTKYKKSITQ